MNSCVLFQDESDPAPGEAPEPDLARRAHIVPFPEVESVDPAEHVYLAPGELVEFEELPYPGEPPPLGCPVLLDRVVIEYVFLTGPQPHVVYLEHVLIPLGDQEAPADHLPGGRHGFQGRAHGGFRHGKSERCLLHRCGREALQVSGYHPVAGLLGIRESSFIPFEIPSVVGGDPGPGHQIHRFQLPDGTVHRIRIQFGSLGYLGEGCSVAYGIQHRPVLRGQVPLLPGCRCVIRDLLRGHDIRLVEEYRTQGSLFYELPDPGVNGLLVSVAICVDVPSSLPQSLKGARAH